MWTALPGALNAAGKSDALAAHNIPQREISCVTTGRISVVFPY
jgi:hypothetical protein